MKRHLTFFFWLAFACAATAQGDARLWLRLSLTDEQSPTTIAVVGDSLFTDADRAIVRLAEAELRQHWTGTPVMLQAASPNPLQLEGASKASSAAKSGAATSPQLGGLRGAGGPRGAGAFSVEKSPQGSIRILSSSAQGLLYGVYFILRSQTMGDGCLCATLGSDEKTVQQPTDTLRPIFLADDLEQIERRGLLTTLARACASLGINAITAPLLEGADTLRSYGIQLLPPTDHLAQQPPPVGGGGRGPSSERGQHFLTDSYLDRWHFYLAGRRAWNSSISTEQIAFEWLAQTFTESPLFIMPMREKLLNPDADPADVEQALQEAARRY